MGVNEPAVESPPLLGHALWHRTFHGFEIEDVAVRDRRYVYLCLRDTKKCEADIEHERRCVLLTLDGESGMDCAHQALGDFASPRLGVARSPLAQAVLASRRGTVWAMGSKRKGIEDIGSTDRPSPIHRVRCIAGYAYAAGLLREVWRRPAIGRWEQLPRIGLPAPTGDPLAVLFEVGFCDLDGFAEDDLVAVGGKGDAFHWDGGRWTALELPTRDALHAVCCGGDGWVYVTSERDGLFRGRGRQWQKVAPLRGHPRDRAVWFDGALWVASRDRLTRFVDDQQAPDPAFPAGGRIDAADGLLVVASDQFVHGFDGQTWRLLVAPYPSQPARV